MPRPLRRAFGWPVRDVSFSTFLVAVVLSLLRARDLPSFELGLGEADLSIGPVDLALGATAVLAAWRLRTRPSLPSPGLVLAAAAFGLLVFATAIPNGADALTSAGRLAELFALTLAGIEKDGPPEREREEPCEPAGRGEGVRTVRDRGGEDE